MDPGRIAQVRNILSAFCPGKLMPIVVISESLLRRSTAADGRILRDRVLSGFCVRLNARKRTFLVATSVKGQQYRRMLGHWPLMSVDEARARALELLRQCRNGQRPSQSEPTPLPTMREAREAYCIAKKIKASSLGRYESFLRTHFGDWLDRPVSDLGTQEFSEHCLAFAQTRGAALVELGRGVVGALIRYVNAVHGLTLETPFTRLAGAGLLPARALPRQRRLQEADLPAWKTAVDKLKTPQRDFLYLTLYTGLRRTECRQMQRQHIDLATGVLCVPETKNGKPHTLPITPLMREILERRCAGLNPADELFQGVNADHLYNMAMRVGSPRFMLHDLRKMLATVGEKLGVGDAALRRILNHTAPKADVLHRHYVALNTNDALGPLIAIQVELSRLMMDAFKTA